MYSQLLFYLTFCIHIAYFHQESTFNKTIPIVITTWQFVNATEKAWDTIYNKKGTALDAIEFGCSICEIQQCDGTVGYGGSPDENGETTLDSMIMDGTTMNIGAVAALRRIKSAISVARQILDHTSHSMLAGDQATAFAKSLGFKEESLITPHSTSIWKKWKDNKCQPNFWINVSPDPKDTCGPYKPNNRHFDISNRYVYGFDSKNHDTIGMVAIDSKNQIAAGTSTNGANHKIAGRVGDSPIPGAGAYADGEVGGAAATGDGDVMLRFLPSFLAVEQMRNGASPTAAAETAIKRITKKYSAFVGGIVAVKTNGEYGAACHGLEKFHFTVSNILLGHPTVQSVSCVQS